MRVLGRLRLSRSSEESTSIERQREIIEQWASAHGHEVIGWAEDIDVSGAVDPFDTPELGLWLNRRAPEWDIIAAWKLDRLGRNAIQLNRLFGWALDHGKTVVSCSESIDLGTWAGRMLANVIAGLAEGELESIRERVRSSRAKLRADARWPGGKAPFGYVGVRNADGAGWHLEIDPEAASIVRRIVAELLDGVTLSTIARDLNAEGIPTPAAYYSASKGRPVTAGRSRNGRRWYATQLRNMLRSKAIRGYAHHNGETVRDDDGMPVELAEPLVTLDEWDAIQAILDGNQDARKDARRTEASPLAGLIFCAGCDAPLHHDLSTVKRANRTYEYRYYRCRDNQREHPMIPAAELEVFAEDQFLDELGSCEVQERVWVPGDSREADLREAVNAYDELTKTAGRAVSTTAKQRLQAQLAALDAQIAELEAAPAREARWEYQATGETYAEAWQAADTAGRRELLQRSGITFTARNLGGKAREVNVRIPFDLRERMGLGPAEPRVYEPIPEGGPHPRVDPEQARKVLAEIRAHPASHFA
jgi:site-specific DNA recombinase